MAIYRWIYANTENAEDKRDYFVGLCDDALLPYQERLLYLSNRLLSERLRMGEKKTQHCWVAGYLNGIAEDKIYIVALGGEQEEILKKAVRRPGSRGLFCVLLYGFTEEDIGIYQRDTRLFDSLKEILVDIHKGKESAEKLTDEEREEIHQFRADISEVRKLPSLSYYNILKSTPEVDTVLWENSREQFTAIQLLGLEDAKRLIEKMPGICTSVTDDIKNYRYVLKETVQKIQSTSNQGKDDKIQKEKSEENVEEIKVNLEQIECEKQERKEQKKRQEKKPEKKQEKKSEKKPAKRPEVGKVITSLFRIKEMKEEKAEREIERRQKFNKRCREWCYRRLTVTEKEWVTKWSEREKSEELREIYKDFLSMYLWMQSQGSEMRRVASDTLNDTAKEAGEYDNVYYPPVNSEEDMQKLVNNWRNAREQNFELIIEMNYQLARKIEEVK